MKTLNRPMFRRGGGVARNTGIVSGFDNGGQVRKYYHDAGPVHNEQFGVGHTSHPYNPRDAATQVIHIILEMQLQIQKY